MRDVRSVGRGKKKRPRQMERHGMLLGRKHHEDSNSQLIYKYAQFY